MEEKTARDIMTAPAVTVEREASLQDAADRMLERSVGSLVVVDGDGKAVGILTDSDFSAKPAFVPFSTFRSRKLLGEWLGKEDAEQIYERARSRRVEEIMSSPPHAVELEDPVDQVLDVMMERDIKHVPVLDGEDRPAGMVARHDLLKLLASERGLAVG